MSDLLKTIMESLDEDSQKVIFKEITGLIQAKTGGLDFNFTMDDILKEVKPAEVITPEQMEEDAYEKSFKDALTKIKTKPTAGFNIQEI